MTLKADHNAHEKHDDQIRVRSRAGGLNGNISSTAMANHWQKGDRVNSIWRQTSPLITRLLQYK